MYHEANAEFVTKTMPKARPFRTPQQTLRHGLRLAPTGGMALEFGVYQGKSLDVIYRTRGEKVYGFDSFEGLPEDWRDGFPKGAFKTEIPEVGAELMVGWFDETLPTFLREHSGDVDFVHMDCDLYSSTRTVLELVGPRLKVGSVLVFDEYMNYPGWEDHEFRAWAEYTRDSHVSFTYEAYTIRNEQVAVRVTGIDN